MKFTFSIWWNGGQVETTLNLKSKTAALSMKDGHSRFVLCHSYG
ncbi:hypothetical protein [Paenibacillus sp. S150]|nr:hypothetical protein [Paenibacillus sp. S150]